MNSEKDTMGEATQDVLEVKAYGDDFYIRTEKGIHRYDVKENKFDLLVKKQGITSWTITGDRVFVGEKSGYSAFALNDGGILIPLKEAIPVAPPTSMIAYEDELWMGSHHGIDRKSTRLNSSHVATSYA